MNNLDSLRLFTHQQHEQRLREAGAERLARRRRRTPQRRRLLRMRINPAGVVAAAHTAPRPFKEHPMSTHISLMLAVDDATEAAAWYQRALGATQLWSLGGAVGLEIDGAAFFLREPTAGFVTPAANEKTTARVEFFVDDPDSFVRRAIEAGADSSADEVRDREAPWLIRRQAGFRDPSGHTWLIGDKSPLNPFPQPSP
jgi:PhnB protein